MIGVYNNSHWSIYGKEDAMCKECGCESGSTSTDSQTEDK